MTKRLVPAVEIHIAEPENPFIIRVLASAFRLSEIVAAVKEQVALGRRGVVIREWNRDGTFEGGGYLLLADVFELFPRYETDPLFTRWVEQHDPLQEFLIIDRVAISDEEAMHMCVCMPFGRYLGAFDYETGES